MPSVPRCPGILPCCRGQHCVIKHQILLPLRKQNVIVTAIFVMPYKPKKHRPWALLPPLMPPMSTKPRGPLPRMGDRKWAIRTPGGR